MSTATKRAKTRTNGTRSAWSLPAIMALSLVLLCGGGDVARGNDAALIQVDGESFGSTPATLSALNPGHPALVAHVASIHGIDMASFEAPAATRGRKPRSCCVLLWPSKDVRKGGVVTYAVESDETYKGDATLEFRRGRKVLYREHFVPESITTVKQIPEEVREHLRVGRTISWGLYFDDHRKPIRTKFRVVNRPNADRQVARVSKSRHMKRQSKITRDLVQATILENNRLYTEALVANLKVIGDHPGATQPMRGIVTTLRRLDAEESELFALVSQAVGGNGSRVNAGINVRTGSIGGSALDPWMPVIPEATIDTPTPTTGADTTKPMSPGDSGVPSPNTETPNTPPTTPTEPVDPQAEPTLETIESMKQAYAEMQEQADNLQRAAETALGDYDAADQAARDAEAAAETAEQAAQAAHEAAEQARQIVQNSPNPTAQELQDMATTGQAEEDTREAADEARAAAETAREAANQARDRARDLEQQASERAIEAADMKRAIDAAQAQLPEPLPQEPTEAPPTPDHETLVGNVEQAQRAVDEAEATMQDAADQLQQAQADYDADPNVTTHERVQDAERAFQRAHGALTAAQEALNAAREALDGGGQPADPVVPPVVIR